MDNPSLPQGVAKLISRFYELIDHLDPSFHRQLATGVFTPDGKFIINTKELNGPDEIANWRSGAENVLSLRRHDVLDAYACGGNVFMTTGVLTLRMKSGKEASSPYCAKCVVDDADGREPRIKEWQGWLDVTPFLKIGFYSHISEELRKEWAEGGM